MQKNSHPERQVGSKGLKTWFDWIVTWVKGFVRRVHHGEKSMITLELVRSNSGTALAESVLRTTPGAVATWYIRHSDHPSIRLIIMLDNLREFQRYIETPVFADNFTRTHIVSVQWLVEVGKEHKAIYKFSGAWAADLQGQTIGINAKAFDVIRYLILEIVNLLPIKGISWYSRVDRYMWEDAIRGKSKLIGDKHDPRIVKIKRPVAKQTQHD